MVVTRPTELELLLQRHVTRGQVESLLRPRGRSLDELDRRHATHLAARHAVLAAIPVEWRRATVDRADLDRFLFEPAVREAWPSPGTGTRLTEGMLTDGAELTVASETEDGVVFGDGIETDPLPFEWGRYITILAAPATLLLVRGPAPSVAPGGRAWQSAAAPAVSL